MSAVISVPVAVTRAGRRRHPHQRVVPAREPLLAIFERAAERTLQEGDPTVRLTLALNLCESLARAEPRAFERLCEDALRWPSRFLLCVLDDLSAIVRAQDAGTDASRAMAQGVHLVELWIGAARCAYTDHDASPQDRVRARTALRALRGRALSG